MKKNRAWDIPKSLDFLDFIIYSFLLASQEVHGPEHFVTPVPLDL